MEKEIKKVLEEKGWGLEKEVYSNGTLLRIEQYTPEGEDYSFTIEFEDEKYNEKLIENISKYANDFDVDDHVEMHAENRGQNGTPNSFTALVADAQWIQNELNELSDALNELLK